MPANTIDPQTVYVRCGTKNRVPYFYVEPTNSGRVDGIAELVFKAADGCKVTLDEVEPSSNCRIVRQEVKDDGRTLEVDLGYEMPGRGTTSLTYALWVRDAAGKRQQAYGGEPAATPTTASAQGASAGESSTNPPPEVQFP